MSEIEYYVANVNSGRVGEPVGSYLNALLELHAEIEAATWREMTARRETTGVATDEKNVRRAVANSVYIEAVHADGNVVRHELSDGAER